MISDQAKTSFEQLFIKSITTNITGDCEIEAIGNIDNIIEDEFVLLMITSPVFRIVAIFYLNREDTAKRFFADKTNSDSQIVSDAEFNDVFFEFANVCCGMMNRELLKYFGYLGMSTPTVLKKQSATFLAALDPGFMQPFKMTVNGSFVLHFTLCVSDFADLDFRADISETEDGTGELELF